MYYHASPVAGIKVLEPRISNHNIPLVYLSEKRENTLVYLSNAVEKFCKEKGFMKLKQENSIRRSRLRDELLTFASDISHFSRIFAYAHPFSVNQCILSLFQGTLFLLLQ